MVTDQLYCLILRATGITFVLFNSLVFNLFCSAVLVAYMDPQTKALVHLPFFVRNMFAITSATKCDFLSFRLQKKLKGKKD
jgi:hypothetical protein